jgi:hypothetical protein
LEKNWVKIYSTSEKYQAELLRGLLEENEISAVVVNKQDSSYLFGEVELYVIADDAIRAKYLITTKEQQ